MNRLRFGSVGIEMVARTGRCLTTARDGQHCGMSADVGDGIQFEAIGSSRTSQFDAENLAAQPW